MLEALTSPKWENQKQQRPSSSNTERPKGPGDDSLGSQFDVFVAPLNEVTRKLEKVKVKAKDEDSSIRRMKLMLTCKAKEKATDHTPLGKATAARGILRTEMETP